MRRARQAAEKVSRLDKIKHNEEIRAKKVVSFEEHKASIPEEEKEGFD